MRLLIVVVMVMASGCVGLKATKGEILLAGIDRRAVGGSMTVFGAALTATAAAVTVGALIANEKTPAPQRDAAAIAAAAVIVPTAIAGVTLLVGGATAYLSGRDLVVSVFDDAPAEVESRGQSKNARSKDADAEEAEAMQERVRARREALPCSPGLDCPGDEDPDA